MTVELQSVTKTFGDTPIFQDLSYRFEFDHVLALVGPSGGGKSTLLRLIAGLIVPEKGTIFINGQPIPKKESALRSYRQAIGIVFQTYNLFPHLSAIANIRLPLIHVHRLSPASATRQADAILDRFQLSSHGAKRPAELSGGQRQRVAIARAIAFNPKLLVLDEPSSALDPEMTAEVLDVIAELRTEGRSFVIASHEMGFVRKTSDFVALVAGGGIVDGAGAASFFDSAAHPATQRFLQKVLKY